MTTENQSWLLGRQHAQLLRAASCVFLGSCAESIGLLPASQYDHAHELIHRMQATVNRFCDLLSGSDELSVSRYADPGVAEHSAPRPIRRDDGLVPVFVRRQDGAGPMSDHETQELLRYVNGHFAAEATGPMAVREVAWPAETVPSAPPRPICHNPMAPGVRRGEIRCHECGFAEFR